MRDLVRAGVVSLVQERTNKRLYHLQEVVKLQASPSDRNISNWQDERGGGACQ